MNVARQSFNIMEKILRGGGYVLESSLPHDNVLAMHRLTTQGLIAPMGLAENGETVFGVTTKGIKEVEEQRQRWSH